MKFQLIQNNSNLLSTSAVEHILTNRGIAKEDMLHYLKTTDEDINCYILFGEKNLKDAAAALVRIIGNNYTCLIIVDSDCDGYTSAALLINYLYDLFPAWVNNNLSWVLHQGKQHGIDEKEFDLKSLCLANYKMIICPDSSSNDYNQHSYLKQNGIVT